MQSKYSLAKIGILVGLPPAALERIQRRCSWRGYQPGEPIVDYLDSSDKGELPWWRKLPRNLDQAIPQEGGVRLEKPVPILSNLKMQFVGTGGQDIPGSLYAKVLGADPGSSEVSSIRFTSSSPEIETFLRGLLSQ